MINFKIDAFNVFKDIDLIQIIYNALKIQRVFLIVTNIKIFKNVKFVRRDYI